MGEEKGPSSRMPSDPLDLQEMAGDTFHLKSQRFDEAQMESSIQTAWGRGFGGGGWQGRTAPPLLETPTPPAEHPPSPLSSSMKDPLHSRFL